MLNDLLGGILKKSAGMAPSNTESDTFFDAKLTLIDPKTLSVYMYTTYCVLLSALSVVNAHNSTYCFNNQQWRFKPLGPPPIPPP